MTTVTIEFSLDKVSGPFASKHDLAEAITEQVADITVDTPSGNEAEYEVTDWTLV